MPERAISTRLPWLGRFTAARACLCAAYLCLAGSLSALEPAEIFQSGMVLQRGKDHLFWGKAEPGGEITISSGERSVKTKANARGRWKTSFPVLESPGPYEIRIAGDGTQIVLSDVLVGEVWLAAGQSNMARKMKDPDVASALPDITTASDPQLRIYTGRQNVTLDPREKRNAQWLACTPENAPEFSALAYYFARGLRKDRGVPVGILVGAVGGSKIQSWIPLEDLRDVPEAAAILTSFEQAKNKPGQQWTPAALKFAPSACYNAMVHSLAPFPLRGVIWYQGESNSPEPASYEPLLRRLIVSWRERWAEPELPFVYVQLPGFKVSKPDADPASSPSSEVYTLDANQPGNWPILREAQANVRDLPATAMVPTIDIGNPFNLHPDNKQEVARRLSRAALATVYGREADCQAPELSAWKIEGSEISLQFAHCGEGLIFKGEKGEGFFIAGEDGIYHPAEARIAADRVIVRSPQVTNPQNARYAWVDSPLANLFGRNGLPALPFRTDRKDAPRP